MPTTAAWLALPLCAACLALNVRAEDAPAETEKADALVARLDDEAFAVRQDAESALLAGGQAALDAVRTAVTQKGLSPDRRARLATLAARLEAVLAWERITKPRRADFATGKVKVKDALLALEKEFGMAPGSFDAVAEREVDVKLGGVPWSGALSEIARQAEGLIRSGDLEWPDRYKLVSWHDYFVAPCGQLAVSASEGTVIQGFCKEYTQVTIDSSPSRKYPEEKHLSLLIESLMPDFFAQNFGRSLKGVVLTGGSGQAHPIPESSCTFQFSFNKVELDKDLMNALGTQPFEVTGTLVWDWPLELHRHVFAAQEQAAEVRLGGNRRVSVAVEEVNGKFMVCMKERIDANEEGPALTEGWFIPRDKDGRRIARAAIKSSGGHGGGENGFYAESENTWTLETRPAEIYYEYPVGFEKRELAFHLKGLTLPKPKPMAPEKP